MMMSSGNNDTPSNKSSSAAFADDDDGAVGGGRAPPAVRLIASANTQAAIVERFGTRRDADAKATAAATYWSEYTKCFGGGSSGNDKGKSKMGSRRRVGGCLLGLTRDESDLLLNRQEQLYVGPSQSRGGTRSCRFYVVDGTSPFPASSEARWRCLFFIAATALDRSTTTDGPSSPPVSVAIVVPSPDADPTLIDQAGNTLVKLLNYLSLLQVDVDEIHLMAIKAAPDGDNVDMDEDGDDDDDDDDDTLAVVEYFQESLGPKFQDKCRSHVITSKADACRILEAHGMNKQDVPAHLGGALSKNENSKWLLEHSTVVDGNEADDDDSSSTEEEQGAAPTNRSAVPAATAAPASSPARPSAAAASGGRAATATTSSSSAAVPTRSSNDMSAAATQEFIRKRNAVYARRKYARRKIEVEVLKEQRHDLEKQRQRLQSENRRLNGLLAQAERYVDLFQSTGGVGGGGIEVGTGAASRTAITQFLPGKAKFSQGNKLKSAGGSGLGVRSTSGGSAASSSAADAAASASRRTRLLLMEQLRLQDQLALSSAVPSSSLGAARESASPTVSNSRRYLESLHGYSTGSAAVSAEDVLSSSPAQREPTRPHDTNTNNNNSVSLQLALLHRQQQQHQHQEQLNALRAAATSSAVVPSSSSYHPVYSTPLLSDYYGAAPPTTQHQPGFLLSHSSQSQGVAGPAAHHHHQPNPSLVTELLWLQRDLELQNQHQQPQSQSSSTAGGGGERRGLSAPAPYPRNL